MRAKDKLVRNQIKSREKIKPGEIDDYFLFGDNIELDSSTIVLS